MSKSLFNKHLSINLFPLCVRLCPAVSGNGMIKAETTGSSRTQIRHKISVKLFYNNGLQICVRDSVESK